MKSLREAFWWDLRRGPQVTDKDSCVSPPSGVVTGNSLRELFQRAQEEGFVIPNFCCYSTSSCNSVLRAAQENKSPVAITVASNDAVHAINLALHVRKMARQVGIPVILHSQHCHKLLPMLEELLMEDERHFHDYGEPLFSSHALNFSRDPYWEESVAICAKYFAQCFVPIHLWLDMQLGDCHQEAQAHRIVRANQVLSTIGDMFSIVIQQSTECKSCSDEAQRKIPPNIARRPRDGHKPMYYTLQASAASCLGDEAIALSIGLGAVKLNVTGDVYAAPISIGVGSHIDPLCENGSSPMQKSNPQCGGNADVIKRRATIFERCRSKNRCDEESKTMPFSRLDL